jgi:hypothetical protein
LNIPHLFQNAKALSKTTITKASTKVMANNKKKSIPFTLILKYVNTRVSIKNFIQTHNTHGIILHNRHFSFMYLLLLMLKTIKNGATSNNKQKSNKGNKPDVIRSLKYEITKTYGKTQK